jgi:hypothetical protein
MEMTVSMTGTSPLVMHNPRLSDSTYALTRAIKELTSSKDKTDEVDAQIAELEFKGGLYLNEQGPYVDAQAIKQTWVCGGRLSKKGTAIERGLTMLGEIEYPLIYQGPRTDEELWQNKNFVWRTRTVVKAMGRTSTVFRTRPMFRHWELNIPIDLDTNMLNPKDFTRAVTDSGLYIGLLDARRIGRGRFAANITQNGKGR